MIDCRGQDMIDCRGQDMTDCNCYAPNGVKHMETCSVTPVFASAGRDLGSPQQMINNILLESFNIFLLAERLSATLPFKFRLAKKVDNG